MSPKTKEILIFIVVLTVSIKLILTDTMPAPTKKKRLIVKLPWRSKVTLPL